MTSVIAERKQFCEIKAGAFRRTLLVGRFAIKLAKSRHGCAVNRCEREVWRKWANCFPEWRALLCPILWADRFGFVVLMPRCAPAPAEVADAMLEDLPFPAPPWEGKPEDFGLLEGRAVAIDYGSTHFERDYFNDQSRRRGCVL